MGWGGVEEAGKRRAAGKRKKRERGRKREVERGMSKANGRATRVIARLQEQGQGLSSGLGVCGRCAGCGPLTVGVAHLQVCHINFRNGFFFSSPHPHSLPLLTDAAAAVECCWRVAPCCWRACPCCCCQFDKHKQTVSDAAVVLLLLSHFFSSLLASSSPSACWDKMKTHASASPLKAVQSN